MKFKIQQKWYNSNQLVGTLLIFWPPLGLYGVYRSDTISPKWKKATYAALALAVTGGVILYLS